MKQLPISNGELLHVLTTNLNNNSQAAAGTCWQQRAMEGMTFFEQVDGFLE